MCKFLLPTSWISHLSIIKFWIPFALMFCQWQTWITNCQADMGCNWPSSYTTSGLISSSICNFVIVLEILKSFFFSCFAIQCFDPKSIKFQFPSRCGVSWYSYILWSFKLFPLWEILKVCFSGCCLIIHSTPSQIENLGLLLRCQMWSFFLTPRMEAMPFTWPRTFPGFDPSRHTTWLNQSNTPMSPFPGLEP